jgi:hypothetical protein
LDDRSVTRARKSRKSTFDGEGAEEEDVEGREDEEELLEETDIEDERWRGNSEKGQGWEGGDGRTRPTGWDQRRARKVDENKEEEGDKGGLTLSTDSTRVGKEEDEDEREEKSIVT